MTENRPRLHGLRNIRQELGLTQEGFGELVGMTDVSIRRMENGQQGFTASAIERIALHSKRSWWQVLGYQHPPEVSLASETAEAISIMERLNGQGRQAALAHIRTVANTPGMSAFPNEGTMEGS